MATRYPNLFRLLIVSAWLLACAAWLFPESIRQLDTVLALALILGIGLPHGATDHLIFRKLARPFWGSRQWLRFYTRYLGLMAGLALVWLMVPQLALLIFVGLSLYHFGQCNWAYSQGLGKWEKAALAISWGAFVLAGPIFLHFEEARPILEAILRQPIAPVSPGLGNLLVGGLLVLNIGLTLRVRSQRIITNIQTLGEIASLLTLTAVFSALPMMAGFGVFFAGWHALSSVADQIQFFQKSAPGYIWKDYVRQTAPLSLAALAGLAGMVWVNMFSTGLAAVFVFISIVTLPHMVIMDQLYDELGESPESMIPH